MSRTRPSFLERLKQGPLLFDGGMGTELYKRGVFINRNFDATNIADPDLVRDIHRQYVKAGAQCIETNTFGANRIKLTQAGLAEKIEAINRAGVALAREVAGDQVYVAGAVGPTGLVPGVTTPLDPGEIKELFAEQIGFLVDQGVDVLCLETFTHLEELRLALQAAREVAGVTPVMAQMAFGEDGNLIDGTTPDQVVEKLVGWGAHVVGANCAQGPATLHEVARRMVGRSVPISIQPNAGYPRRVGERYLYMATPDYFAVYAMRLFRMGVAIVGGCCGTTPEHISKMAGSARMAGGGRLLVEATAAPEPVPEAQGVTPWPIDEKSALGRKLAHGKELAVSVEVNPPTDLDDSRVIEGARMLKAAGVDVVNIPDNARATVRLSNLSLGLRIRQEVGLDIILHVTCRDRNFLAMQSELLGYHLLGIRNLVIITGDPPKVGDYPDATAVYDLDSIGLLRVASGFNRGLDPSGRNLKGTTSFLLGAGVEPAAVDYERELSRLEQKKAAGAEFVMTQPIYDTEVIERFLRDTAHLGLPTLIGLLPLASYANAEFLHNEVPGMSVPEAIRERMRLVGKGPKARAEGVKIAQEILGVIKDKVAGVYIMTPFGRFEAAVEILEVLGYKRPKGWQEQWRE